VKTSAILPPDLYKRVFNKLEPRQTLVEAINQGLELWLDGVPTQAASGLPPHVAELMSALDTFFDPALDLGAAHNRLREDMRQVLKERLWESHPKFKKGKR